MKIYHITFRGQDHSPSLGLLFQNKCHHTTSFIVW